MNYNKTNNILGWVCFLIASVTYILTLEPSGSFWDCGEFISAAYKLQVVHQPGAPLFLMIQKMFSFLAFGNVHQIAYWMNVGSALSSGATILFLFWTITALAKKVVLKPGEELTTAKLITIMGSGAVGALAYTFSDSFWFSAVESEVYAMSSLCTAIVFWAILKWDAHADEPKADRWLIFIAYIMGLSIGVHLLNLLAIPAISVLYYFRRTKLPTSRGTLLSLFVGIVILAIIQYGVIQYMIKFAAYFDLFFVNTLGLGFGTGVVFFIALVVGLLIYGILYSIRAAKPVLNLALVCLTFILIGYSSFSMIVIRAKANTSLNNSSPDNVFALLSYLNREQYGDRPLAYGQYFDSKRLDYDQGGNIYRKGKDKYEVAGRKFDIIYDRNTLFPRMYSDDQQHPAFYREWMQMGQTDSPNMLQNLGFFFSYQTGFMYARYFAWNFVGRQNDEQGNGNYKDGNWISGIKPIDQLHVGPQDQLSPNTLNNKAYNRFFFLPFILGLIGAFWHFKRNQKDAGIVGLLFFFTGMAIVIYLNQTPLQPRERDYAYTGSFYAFAIWIGLGVAGIKEFFKKLNPATAAYLATGIGLLAAPAIMAQQGWDDHDRSTKYTPRDFATDYLQSCAPNAILFTYGDNDTYPLWYVQEVEGVRPDVRIVNLSLLGTDWYIRQLKKPVNKAEALPITMDDDKFVQGVRDMIGFNDYHMTAPVELKSLFDLLVSDNDEDKVAYQDGSRENFFPTKDFKLTIDPKQVIATHTVDASLKDSITPVMQWKYNKGYIGKQDLAMFDILAHNNWKRPVYFAVTVPSSNYNGLDKYLYDEGFAYRLMPLKTAPADTTSSHDNDDKVNPGAMYNNMINKFVWGNMKNARYLDPESTRMIGIVIKSFNQLATQLIKEGKLDEARKTLQKSLDVVPDQNYSLYFTLHRYYTADLLYQLKETSKANALVKNTADYITSELSYLYALAQAKQNLSSDDIQLGMSVLNEMIKITEKNGQTALNKQLKDSFNGFESRFMSVNGGN